MFRSITGHNASYKPWNSCNRVIDGLLAGLYGANRETNNSGHSSYTNLDLCTNCSGRFVFAVSRKHCVFEQICV